MSYNSLGRLKVLLAEDNPINQLFFEEMLKGWGVSPIIANDGKEAVEIATAQKFDIIFLDLHMPNMNGFEASKNIKQNGQGSLNRETSIYALSADNSSETEAEAKDHGMSGLLAKPVEMDELYKLLESNCPV